MHRKRPIVLAILVLGIAAAAQAALGAGGGNALGAKLCQKNGWQTLQSSSGSPFASQSECVSHAANGGTLFAPKVTATDLGCDVANAQGSDVWLLVATGFTPNSPVTIDGTPLPRTFDNHGSGLFYFIPDSAGSPTTQTFSDGNGLQATVTFEPTGCGTAFTPNVTATDLGCNVPGLQGHDVWLQTATGFTPNSPVTIDGAPLPRMFDNHGSGLFYFIPDSAGSLITETFSDGNGLQATVTFGPTKACP